MYSKRMDEPEFSLPVLDDFCSSPIFHGLGQDYIRYAECHAGGWKQDPPDFASLRLSTCTCTGESLLGSVDGVLDVVAGGEASKEDEDGDNHQTQDQQLP